MSGCSLPYIPERLQYSEHRELIEEFHLNDILYRRVPEKLKNNPYGSISLTDLSHNIGVWGAEEISKKRDVLFSIREDEDLQVYDQEVIGLKIISLNDQNCYDKIFYCPKHNELQVRLLLLHSPEVCMYPHAVFQFFIYIDDDEIEVTFENYRETLGERKKYKYLRDILRHELAKMIIREEISYK